MDTLLIESFLTTPEYLIAITLALPWGIFFSIPCFLLAKSLDKKILSTSAAVSGGIAISLLAGQILLGIDIFKAPTIAANILTGTVGTPQTVVSICFILSSITCFLGASLLTLASNIMDSSETKSTNLRPALKSAKVRVKAAEIDSSHLVNHVVSNRDRRVRANG